MQRARFLWIAGVVAVALVLRVGVVLLGPAYRPTSDSLDYDRYGLAVADTGAFPASNFPAGGPTAYRPPAYPYFVGAVYAVAGDLGARDADGRLTQARWTFVRLTQALLGIGVVLLTGVLAAELWGGLPGLMAMAVAAVFPPLISLGDTLLSENLLVLFELGAVAALLRHRRARRPGWLGLSGLLVGLATLTHPNAALLAIPLAVGACLPVRRSWRALLPAATLIAAVLLTVLPWTVRNAVQMHALIPVSTEAGPTLAGTYNATAARDRGMPGNWIEWWRDPANRAVLQRTRGREVATDRGLQSQGVAYLVHHPRYVLTVTARNLQRLTGLAGSRWTSFYARGAALPRWLVALDGYAIVALLVLAVPAGLSRAARSVPRFLWFVPLVMLASVLPLIGYERVRAPVDPFLIMLAAIPLSRAAAYVTARLASAERRPVAKAAAA